MLKAAQPIIERRGAHGYPHQNKPEWAAPRVHTAKWPCPAQRRRAGGPVLCSGGEQAAVSCDITTAVRSEANVRVINMHTPILVPPKTRLKEVTHVRADKRSCSLLPVRAPRHNQAISSTQGFLAAMLWQHAVHCECRWSSHRGLCYPCYTTSWFGARVSFRGGAGPVVRRHVHRLGDG